MINLLPSNIKNQVRFAKFNTNLRRYTIVLIVIAALLSIILVTGNMVNAYFMKDVENRLDEQEQEITRFSDTEQRAKEIDSQVKKVSTVLAKTTRYSDVVKDIAKSLPRGSKIGGLTLSGDASQPLTLTILAENEKAALAVEPSLEKNDRFSFVDIQSFRQVGSAFEIDLALSFSNSDEATK